MQSKPRASRIGLRKPLFFMMLSSQSYESVSADTVRGRRPDSAVSGGKMRKLELLMPMHPFRFQL